MSASYRSRRACDHHCQRHRRGHRTEEHERRPSGAEPFVVLDEPGGFIHRRGRLADGIDVRTLLHGSDRTGTIDPVPSVRSGHGRVDRYRRRHRRRVPLDRGDQPPDRGSRSPSGEEIQRAHARVVNVVKVVNVAAGRCPRRAEGRTARRRRSACFRHGSRRRYERAEQESPRHTCPHRDCVSP
jgi:hypothetical protein